MIIYPGWLNDATDFEEKCLADVKATANETIKSCILMILMAAPLLPTLLFMTYKIARLVWPHEIEVITMLLFLCLTLSMEIVFFVVLLYSRMNIEWCCSEGTNCGCISGTLSRAPSILLGNAIICNMYKWRYFKLRVDAYIRIYLQRDESRSAEEAEEDHSSEDETREVEDREVGTEQRAYMLTQSVVDTSEQEQKRLQRAHNVNKCVCITLLITFNLLTISSAAEDCYRHSEDWLVQGFGFQVHHRVLERGIYCFYFFCFSTFFMYTGVKMSLTLKQHFGRFYRKYTSYLWLACFLLSVPLMLHVIWDILEIVSQRVNEFLTDPQNYWYAKPIFSFIIIYIPIITQTSSLVFGYTRKKMRERKQRRKDRPNQSSATIESNTEQANFFDPPIEHYRSTYVSFRRSALEVSGQRASRVQRQTEVSSGKQTNFRNTEVTSGGPSAIYMSSRTGILHTRAIDTDPLWSTNSVDFVRDSAGNDDQQSLQQKR